MKAEMFVTYRHPFKIVTAQSVTSSLWIVQEIPPKPMKVSAFTAFMDDFGDLVKLDHAKFAIAIGD